MASYLSGSHSPGGAAILVCRIPRRPGLLLAAAIALLAGCSRSHLQLPVVENLRPVAKLTYAPASATVPTYYACDLYWSGADADGYVDHFLYCLDPPSALGADTPWVATNENRMSYVFRCDEVDPPGTPTQPVSYHVFVLKAVDNLGACSEPVVDAFTSFTLAPTVSILQPRAWAGALLWPTLPPASRFEFTGSDPDGRTSTRPVKFKYRLFRDNGTDMDFHSILLDPDLLRKRYAPAFADWDSITGDTCRVVEKDMLPGHEYDVGLSVGLAPSTWILDENTTTNVTISVMVVNTLGGPKAATSIDLIMMPYINCR